MAKTNFSKVEAALDEGIRKMTVSKINELADIATGADYDNVRPQLEKSKQSLVRQVILDLERLEKKDKKIYVKLQFKKEYLFEKLSRPEELTEAEWRGLVKLKEMTKKFIEETFPQASDEKIVEEQIESHLRRRINVNDNWISL